MIKIWLKWCLLRLLCAEYPTNWVAFSSSFNRGLARQLDPGPIAAVGRAGIENQAALFQTGPPWRTQCYSMVFTDRRHTTTWWGDSKVHGMGRKSEGKMKEWTQIAGLTLIDAHDFHSRKRCVGKQEFLFFLQFSQEPKIALKETFFFNKWSFPKMILRDNFNNLTQSSWK